MSWGRLDDTLHDHPKVDDLSLAALGLWTKCLSKALRHRKTSPKPGFISTATVKSFAGTQTSRLVLELTTPIEGKKHGMWEPVEGGWMVHDFIDYLPKERDPEEASESGRKGAAAKWAKEGKQIADSHSSSQPTASQQPELEHGSEPDESMADGMANDGPRASRSAFPSRPVPSVVTSGGESPETLHYENPPPSKIEYAGRCQRHLHVADPPPCGDCRAERLREERDADRRARLLEDAIRDCPDCDGTLIIVAGEDRHPTGKQCHHPRIRRPA